jgi:hypothetical protein
MKRFILGGLSLLMLSAVAAPAVQAQATSEAPPANAEVLGMAVTPFNLVFLAYQGFFESEGIPKYDGLISGYQSGRVKPEDLVKVGISMRRLSPDTLNNRGYLRAVENQLNSLYGSSNN